MEQQLYRSVKASERLPNKKDTLSPNGFYFCKCEGDVVDVCQFKESWNEFRHITIGCNCQPYSEEKANVIEWLEPLPSEGMSVEEVWDEVVGICIKADLYKTNGYIQEFRDEMDKLKQFHITRK